MEKNKKNVYHANPTCMLTLPNPQRAYHAQLGTSQTNYNPQAAPVAKRENIGNLLESVIHARKDIIEIQTTTKPSVKVATEVNIKNTTNRYFVLIVYLVNTKMTRVNHHAKVVP